jgi:alkylhydroperoxidase family enzyme
LRAHARHGIHGEIEMSTPRISYVPLERMDEAMRLEMQRCAEHGTPRPESSAVRAHVPACFWSFANSWQAIFREGVCDHAIKELCRLYVSRSVKCEFCGNQRSIKGAQSGVNEAQVDDLIDFEKSTKYNAREKAALAYAEAITWRLNVDDSFWARMQKHFSEAELVEIGCFIALTMGQQSWLRLLDIEHHQVMTGTPASMAPGFETPEALARSKASPTYWAKQDAAAKKGTA